MIIHLPSGRAVPGTLRGLGADLPPPEIKPGSQPVPEQPKEEGRLSKLYKRWWMLPLRIPLLPVELPVRAAQAAWRGTKAAVKHTPGLVRKLPAAYKKTESFFSGKIVPAIERVEQVAKLVEQARKDEARLRKKRGKQAVRQRAELPGFMAPTAQERMETPERGELPGMLAPTLHQKLVLPQPYPRMSRTSRKENPAPRQEPQSRPARPIRPPPSTPSRSVSQPKQKGRQKPNVPFD